jgi:hypothetical protein
MITKGTAFHGVFTVHLVTKIIRILCICWYNKTFKGTVV